MILGLILVIFGFYSMSKGSGADKPVGLGIVGVGWFLIGVFDTEHPANMGIGAVILVIAILWGVVYAQNEKDGTNARRRAAELEQIEQERIAAIASQQPGEPWKVRYATSPCPHCGHYKVRNANWEDKRYSVAFWGAASSKIGKQFKCEHCGEMW